VAHGSAIGNQTKVSTIRRVLVGLGALGALRVMLMPDRQRLCERAVEGLTAGTLSGLDIVILEMPVTGQAEDSAMATGLMAQAGVFCLVVLGGDGTARVVGGGAGEAPLLPISTGTIAGLSAGAVALGLVERSKVTYRHKRLEVFEGGTYASQALVDVAAVEGRFVASRAVWDMSRLRQVVVTRASPSSIGISAIVGAVRPLGVDEPAAVALTFVSSDDRERCCYRVLAAVGPGLVATLGIAQVREMIPGERVQIRADRPLVLALDDEREIALAPGQEAAVTLRLDGPWIVEPDRVMHELAAGGHLCTTCKRTLEEA